MDYKPLAKMFHESTSEVSEDTHRRELRVK